MLPHSQADVDRLYPIRGKAYDPMEVNYVQRLAYKAALMVDDRLVDYPSARFRDVYAVWRSVRGEEPEFSICGQVEAKNRLGGYTGWQHFVVFQLKMFTPVRLSLEGDIGGDLIFTVQCEKGYTNGYVRDTRTIYGELVSGKRHYREPEN